MSKGMIASLVVATLAVSAMLMAFLGSASRYVTFGEARDSTSDSLYVVGDLDKSTLSANVKAGEVRFVLKDEKGERVQVLYKGPQPSNMGEATKIVVHGGMKGDVFVARDLLVKCPSKYQGEKA